MKLLPEKILRRGLLFAAAAVLSGCANLNAVRDFAAEAESISSYQTIPADFVNANVRRQALYGRDESVDKLQSYKDYQELFVARQAVLTTYMGALVAVADDDVINYQKNIDAAANAATKADVLDKSSADLIASAANLVAKLATDGARRKLLRDIVTRCDPAIQELTSALAETVSNDYVAFLNGEDRAADSLREDAAQSQNLGLKRLTHYTLREHAIELAQRKESAAAYAKALAKIGAGHAQLAAHIGDFSAKQFVAEIKGYQDELKSLEKQLRN